MKTFTIRLPDVEAAMLVEAAKANRAYKDLQGLWQSRYERNMRKCYEEGRNPNDQKNHPVPFAFGA